MGAGWGWGGEERSGEERRIIQMMMGFIEEEEFSKGLEFYFLCGEDERRLSVSYFNFNLRCR